MIAKALIWLTSLAVAGGHSHHLGGGPARFSKLAGRAIPGRGWRFWPRWIFRGRLDREREVGFPALPGGSAGRVPLLHSSAPSLIGTGATGALEQSTDLQALYLLQSAPVVLQLPMNLQMLASQTNCQTVRACACPTARCQAASKPEHALDPSYWRQRRVHFRTAEEIELAGKPMQGRVALPVEAFAVEAAAADDPFSLL